MYSIYSALQYICYIIIININTVLHAVVILEMKIISEGTNPEVGRHRVRTYLTALSENPKKNLFIKYYYLA